MGAGTGPGLGTRTGMLIKKFDQEIRSRNSIVPVLVLAPPVVLVVVPVLGPIVGVLPGIGTGTGAGTGQDWGLVQEIR